MAFDGSAVFTGMGNFYDVHVDLARAYITRDEENVEMEILDEDRVATLQAFAATLIPGDEIWPSGADIGISGYVDKTLVLAPNLRQFAFGALDLTERFAAQSGDQPFAALPLDARVMILQQVETGDFVGFGLLKELTFESYYRHPLVNPIVQARTGFRPRTPVEGVGLAQMDDIFFMLPERDETWPPIRGIEL
jgi:hypothetical protein